LANELAQIAENCGIDVWEAIELANKHPRVKILQPGPGVGGHCIPIDPLFLTENSTKTGIIHLARDINESMPNHVIHSIRDILYGLKDPTLTVIGVSYKGDVEDTRETPALKFIQLAKNEGYQVKCHDPCAKGFVYELLEMDEAMEDSDCVVLMTNHNVFRNINPSLLKMRNKNLIDTKNFLDHEKWRDSGFNVKILGDGHYTGHSLQK
ncbi:MAG: UDP-N-acetyl-D-mannosamine dehydrogenase, partial [Bacteroidia bacterium]